MNAVQQQSRASTEYERALETLRRMLDVAVAQAQRGEAQPLNVEALKLRLRHRLSRRKRAD